MEDIKLILVINPGSTSTKLALFRGADTVSSVTIEHSRDELSKFTDINQQLNFRTQIVERFLREEKIMPKDLSAIAARGGAIGNLESGGYLVDEELVKACINSKIPHPANLAAIIAFHLISRWNYDLGLEIPAYIYDAVCGLGKPPRYLTITGLSQIDRPFLTHVLNSRAVAIEQSKRDEVDFYNRNYIVCHMGGGITSNLIEKGKIVDFVGDDAGTFSPERAGGLPARDLVRLCFNLGKNEKEMQRLMKGQGGFMSYFGISDLREIEEKAIQGDTLAKDVLKALVVQLSKDIASLSTVVFGNIDNIILTGGMAHSKNLIDEIKPRVSHIAQVKVIPGSFEMEALAGGIYRILRGEEEVHRF